jgi:transcriptional regulator with GAF, ATPase, and Fis domain
VRESTRYFVTDLGSRNGTFFYGNYLIPGVEIELKRGVPIAIGMTILGIGSGSLSEIIPHLDSMGLTRETGNNSGIFAIHKGKTNQKKLELSYRVTDLLQKGLPKNDSLEQLLEVFLEFLVKIDTATFVLVHPETGKTIQVISKSRENGGNLISGYPQVVVDKVLEGKKPLVIVDAKAEELDEEFTTTLKMRNVTSVMCVPMISSSEVVGVLYLESMKKPYPFPPEDVLFFQDIASLTAAFVMIQDLTTAS